MPWSIDDDADAATWTAMDTNDPQDWDNAIELAREADRRDPTPGARD